MNTAAKRAATPQLVVGMLRMMPLDTQIHMIFGTGVFGGNVTMIPCAEDPEKPEMIFLNTEANKERALKFRYGILEQQKDLSGVFWMINKPDRLQLLNFVSGIWELNGEYEEILRDAWISTEFPHQLPNRTLISMFAKADTVKMMNDAEKAKLNELPEVIPVWRGYSGIKQTRLKGLSWTLNRDKAIWFATRWHKPQARLLTGRIKKKHVYAYFNTRSEEELVVNPNHMSIQDTSPIKEAVP
jgi:hypothetical protein